MPLSHTLCICFNSCTQGSSSKECCSRFCTDGLRFQHVSDLGFVGSFRWGYVLNLYFRECHTILQLWPPWYCAASIGEDITWCRLLIVGVASVVGVGKDFDVGWMILAECQLQIFGASDFALSLGPIYVGLFWVPSLWISHEGSCEDLCAEAKIEQHSRITRITTEKTQRIWNFDVTQGKDKESKRVNLIQNNNNTLYIQMCSESAFIQALIAGWHKYWRYFMLNTNV